MNVQLLWFPGCPHADAARAALAEAMRRAQVATPVEEIDVSASGTPPALRGWGSPTVLIDGRDVAGAREGDAMACRLYQGGGAPSVDLIERALRDAAAAAPPEAGAAVVRAPGLDGGGALLAEEAGHDVR